MVTQCAQCFRTRAIFAFALDMSDKCTLASKNQKGALTSSP